MAGSVNKAIILGNLGADPEVKTLQDGSKVVNLSVATSDRWKDKHSGEQRERTEWHRVVIWNESLAGIAERYLRKGGKVYLEGAIQTRKWQGQDGQDRYTTEIVLQRYRGELALLSGPGNGGGDTAVAAATTPKGGGRGGIPDLDDDIPFATSDELYIGAHRSRHGRQVF